MDHNSQIETILHCAHCVDSDCFQREEANTNFTISNNIVSININKPQLLRAKNYSDSYIQTAVSS